MLAPHHEVLCGRPSRLLLQLCGQLEGLRTTFGWLDISEQRSLTAEEITAASNDHHNDASQYSDVVLAEVEQTIRRFGEEGVLYFQHFAAAASEGIGEDATLRC